jgi:hypothetical protein
MNYVFLYTLLGCISGALFYIMQSLEAGGMMPENFLKSIMMGGLGGLIPGAIRQVSRHYVLILQSWIMILLIVYGVSLFNAKLQSLWWSAFIYGYLAHLLWEAYHHNLPKY